MAQSDDSGLTADEGHEQKGDGLPEGAARLVVCENGVTITVEGDSEAVRRHYREHMANALDTTVEELTGDVDEYPHPEFGEGLVPADEFYDDGGA